MSREILANSHRPSSEGTFPVSRVKNHQSTRWIEANQELSSLVVSAQGPTTTFAVIFRMLNRKRYELTIQLKGTVRKQSCSLIPINWINSGRFHYSP
jgi:hypothetical protein